MKILFLDVDGVLNDLVWITTNSPEPNINATIDDLVKHIDPARVQRVNEIVQNTECKIVLCSSTRSDPRMSVVLAKAGLIYPLYDTTPILLWKTNIDGSEYVATERSEEVYVWLIKNAPLIKNFAVLDDQDHGWHKFQFGENLLSDKWIQTSFENGGLTEEHKQRIISLLNG